MPQTLNEIRALLADRGLRPQHRLGQNFLHDANQMQRIIDAAQLKPDETVLEVGPGTGALTERLLEAHARVVAVEIDPQLVSILRERLPDEPDRVHIHSGDILARKSEIAPPVIDALHAFAGDGPFKLIANLPYNIASPLLINLAIDHPSMRLAVVMIQREVADRLLAKPNSKTFGPLTVLIQALCHVEHIATLPPSCFWPPPKVDSAVIRLTRRAQPLTDDSHALRELVHRLFSRRRKQVGTILGRDHPLPPDIDPHARPEQLTVEQLVQLAKTIAC